MSRRFNPIAEGLSIVTWKRYEQPLYQDDVFKRVLFSGMYRRPILEKACILLVCGFTARETARMVGVTKYVTCKLRSRLMKIEELKCGCGEKHGHRGWCSWRLQRSRPRTLTLLRMHINQRGKKSRRAEKGKVGR